MVRGKVGEKKKKTSDGRFVVPRVARITVGEEYFNLVVDGEITYHLEVGERVVPSVVVARAKARKPLGVVHVSKDLGIPVKDTLDYIEVVNGQYVGVGDRVARKETSGGMMEKLALSNAEGVVSLSNASSGVVDIMSELDDIEVKVPAFGRLVSATNNELVIEGDVAHVEGTIGLGKPSIGRVYILGDGNSVYIPKNLPSTCEGLVIVAGRSLSYKLYEEAVLRKASGIIVGGISWDDYDYIVSQSYQGRLPIPVVVMEGWGSIPISQRVLNLLSAEQGHLVKLDPGKEMIHLAIVKQNKKELSKFDITSTWVKGDSGSYVAPAVVLKKGAKVKVYSGQYWGREGVVKKVHKNGKVKVKIGVKILTVWWETLGVV